jgi:hypothetical protein
MEKILYYKLNIIKKLIYKLSEEYLKPYLILNRDKLGDMYKLLGIFIEQNNKYSDDIDMNKYNIAFMYDLYFLYNILIDKDNYNKTTPFEKMPALNKIIELMQEYVLANNDILLKMVRNCYNVPHKPDNIHKDLTLLYLFYYFNRNDAHIVMRLDIVLMELIASATEKIAHYEYKTRQAYRNYQANLCKRSKSKNRIDYINSIYHEINDLTVGMSFNAVAEKIEQIFRDRRREGKIPKKIGFPCALTIKRHIQSDKAKWSQFKKEKRIWIKQT